MSNQEQSEIKALRRVRVKNDGGPGYATTITDADTGQSIDHIYHVKVVDIDVRDNPKIFLWAHNPVIDVVGDAETKNVCPLCKTSKDVEPTEGDRHKIKIDIDDSDVVYAIERLRELRWQHNDFIRKSIGPAEAIHAFMSWRESRDETMASMTDAELVEMFCLVQGWRINNKNYDELIKKVWEDTSVEIEEA